MIETQEYKNFQGFTGDSHKVGVSKPLSELTPDDIINYDKYLCGEINKYVNVTYFGQIPQISLPENADNKPMFSTNNSWDNTFWCSQPPKKDLYMRTLLLNVPNNKRDREYTFTVLDTNVRIVTELTDFQDMYITTKIGKNGGGNPYAAKTEAGTVETGKISGIVKSMLTDTSYVIPVWVITDGTNLWMTSGVIYHKYYVNSGNNLTSQGFFTGIADFNNNKSNSLSFGINPNATAEPVKCTDLIPDDGTPYTVDMNGKKFGIMMSYTSSNYQPRGTFWFNNNIEENTTPFGENNQFIDITAYYGMYMRSIVKNNGEYVWYKPIITDGMVTGYSTDMNAKSDIDNWEILENHNIPIIPPSPGGDDDESDDINFGGSYAGLGAFAKFYLCSGLAVSELNSWINGRSPDWPENFDPMTQIISVSRFATDISSASYGSTTIKFHTAAGAEIDTKIAALHGNGDNIELDLGSVNIPLRMKERGIPFLDYESTIELYIPACGTFILDPQTVLGSTLSVKIWLSTSTGECNSIAYVIRNGVKAPVAYGSGSLAVPMPVTSIGWGSYLAAVTNANIKYYFGALGAASSETQMIYNGYGGNQFGIASGLTGIVGSFQGAAQAEQNLAHLKNSSFTSVSGSFGSTASWNYPFNAYVKITRRHFKKPSNYAHTRGIPLVETKTLRDCSGFTICVNADVTSINATIQEKNMIVEALNNGVIV